MKDAPLSRLAHRAAKLLERVHVSIKQAVSSRDRIFDLVCDEPGIPVAKTHERLSAISPLFLSFLFWPWRVFVLWNLEVDGLVEAIDGRYHPADGGRCTDYRL